VQTHAKVTRPTLPAVLPRMRLFKVIDDLRRRPVMWVSGPAGCGKTTLVASYLEARRLDCLWYQMDAGDADPATFFYYMGLAGKKAAPRRRTPLPLLTPEYLPSLNTFTLRWFENLFWRLKRGYVVVLDNYQDIPPDSMLHEVLHNGLSVVPADVSVLLISRQSPPQGFARQLANNAMGSLGWDDIRLTKAETAGIAQLHFRRKISQEVTTQLHAATDGWAAGLVLLAAYAKREPLAASDLVNRTPEEIFAYFASEVFAKAPPGIQDFLLSTSVLPMMTARLAENLTRSKQAGEILSNLSRNNYFTNKRAGSEMTYQYHRLFREFLLAQAQAVYSPRRLRQIKHTAAKLLEEDNQVEDVFSLRREVSDVPAMVRLIKEHAQTLLLQGRNQTLEHWFGALPPNVLGNDPWLLYWCAASRMYRDPVASKALYEKAIVLFERERDQTGTLLACCGVFEAIIYGLGSYKPFDEWIPRLIELYKKFQPLPSRYLEIKVTLSLLSALVMRQPNHPDMDFWEQKALALLQGDPALDAGARMYLTSILAFYRITAGDLQEAQALFATCESHVDALDVPSVLATLWANIKALCLWTKGEFEACQGIVARGLKVSADLGVYLFAPLLYWQGTAAALSSGDMDHAEALLNGMVTNREYMRGAYQEASLYFAIAWKHLLLKEYPQALFNAELSVRLTEEGGTPLPLLSSRLVNAVALHAVGRDDEAFEQLDQILTVCGKARALLYEFSCRLAQAEFFLDLGDEEAAATAMRTALPLGRKQGYINVWVWRSEVMARLCSKALEWGIETDYVRDLIIRRGLVPEEPPLYLESWPWPLKIYTLGTFTLVKDGTQISFSGKVQKKPLSLLKALIALGSKEVKEEQLADLLWPEADGDHAHVVFKTTLSRLRRLLGRDKAIVIHEGRVSLNPRYCWVDLWGFEGLLDETEATAKKINEAPVGESGTQGCATELLDKALSMYRGPFLMDEEDQVWIKAMRGRLQGRCSRLLMKLGGHLEEQNQWEQAAHYYQRAVDIDSVAEACYQRLMICYHRLGQRAKVMEVYRRGREALAAVLGMEPSAQTEALYKTLI
jgi:LuxR family maltose regulon positive regulatory protein